MGSGSRQTRGHAVLQLVEGGQTFECRIDLATGEAALSASAIPGFGPKAQTPITGSGVYSVAFANVDDELRLLVKEGSGAGGPERRLAGEPVAVSDATPFCGCCGLLIATGV